MKWDHEGIQLTHAEALEWVNWFVLDCTRRGMPPADSTMAGTLLCDFLGSGKQYLSAGKKCRKCHGRGHSNLIVLGATKPQPCDACEGSGMESIFEGDKL